MRAGIVVGPHAVHRAHQPLTGSRAHNVCAERHRMIRAQRLRREGSHRSHLLAINRAHAIRSQRVCGQNPCVEGHRASLHQKTPPIYIHALVSIAAIQKSYSLGISLTRKDRLACDESLTTRRPIFTNCNNGPLVTLALANAVIAINFQNRRQTFLYRIREGLPVIRPGSATLACRIPVWL